MDTTPMDCAAFEQVLFPFLDGELDDARADAAGAHIDACVDCRSRLDAEDAFEKRVRTVLLADAPDGQADAVLERMLADARSTVARPPSRLLRLVAPLASLAAGLLLTVSAGWFFCIGPFECAYLQALEAASDCEGLDPAACAAKLRGAVAALPDLDGVDAGEIHGVGVTYPTSRNGVRRVYETVSGPITVVAVDSTGVTPSFRRQFAWGGSDYWGGEENGRSIVAFKDPATEVLYSVVADRDTEELLALASELRRSLGQ